MARERYSRIAQPGDCKWCLQAQDHDGWLLLDGRTVQRADVPMLFAKLGIAGDSLTLPDHRGRVPVGAGAGLEPGTVGGGRTLTLTAQNLPAHDHAYTDTVMTTGKTGLLSGVLQVTTANVPQANNRTTGKAGEGKPVDVPMPPFVAMSVFVYSGRKR